MNLKYRFFKVVNYGIYSTENFKEKKILQIYNIFLVLVLINVLIIGVLLWFYSFHKQIIFVVFSLIAFLFSLYLNKKGHTCLSKIFIIQYFIICVLIVLCVFSFLTIFPLYFFLIILYCSLIFSNKEKKITIVSEFDKQIRSEGKQFFLNCYQSKTSSDFYWEVKDAVALTKLLDKIKAKVREKFPEIENESAEFKEKLTSGFQIILTNIKDKWILDNYSLPIINTKFNEIYSQITTKAHDTNNLADLVNFAVGANQ